MKEDTKYRLFVTACYVEAILTEPTLSTLTRGFDFIPIHTSTPHLFAVSVSTSLVIFKHLCPKDLPMTSLLLLGRGWMSQIKIRLESIIRLLIPIDYLINIRLWPKWGGSSSADKVCRETKRDNGELQAQGRQRPLVVRVLIELILTGVKPGLSANSGLTIYLQCQMSL